MNKYVAPTRWMYPQNSTIFYPKSWHAQYRHSSPVAQPTIGHVEYTGVKANQEEIGRAIREITAELKKLLSTPKETKTMNEMTPKYPTLNDKWCASNRCKGLGFKEYAGMCPKCWLKLTDAKRALLLGQKPVEVVERVVQRYSPTSTILTVVSILWKLALTIVTVGGVIEIHKLMH